MTMWHNTGKDRISFPPGFAFTLRREPDGEPLATENGAFDISGRVYLDTDASDDVVIKTLSDVSLSAATQVEVDVPSSALGDRREIK